LAEFARHDGAFRRLGYHVAALSVDAPERSARLRARLGMPYPLLCDPERRTVRAWDVYNPRERGGIAHPATAVVDRAGALVWFEREAMARRAKAEDLLAFLQGGAAPPPRAFAPRLRDFLQALRGVR
jgi:peroxiredoxin